MRPKEVLASGDVVWGLFDAELSFDPKGKSVPPNTMKLEMAVELVIVTLFLEFV